MRTGLKATCILVVLAATSARPGPLHASPAATSSPRYGQWAALSFGAYLAPSGGFVADDGGVDVVFHFHGARLADHEWRESGLDAVVVDADLGGTSSAFYAAFDRPERFGELLEEVLAALRVRSRRADVHARRLAVVSFSAGYAAVSRILAVPAYEARIDAVVLLDSLHAPYVDPIPPGASEHGIPFRHLIDERPLAPFIRFGREAMQGKKLLVLTHSSILPPDYGSTTETGFTLALAIDARIAEAEGRTKEGLRRSDTSDARDFHMRGYWGAEPSEHVAHLHMVGDVVREFLVPRWSTCGKL